MNRQGRRERPLAASAQARASLLGSGNQYAAKITRGPRAVPGFEQRERTVLFVKAISALNG